MLLGTFTGIDAVRSLFKTILFFLLLVVASSSIADELSRTAPDKPFSAPLVPRLSVRSALLLTDIVFGRPMSPSRLAIQDAETTTALSGRPVRRVGLTLLSQRGY